MRKFVICPTCEGRGSHVNRAVDGNGITAEEMDELGDDFREDYLNGVYDVRCEECNGERVVPACRCGEPVAEGLYHEFDADPCPFSGCYEHLSEDERDQVDNDRDTAAMYAAEIRAGA